MAKKGGNNQKPPGQTPQRSHTPITLRQEASGLKPTPLKGGGVARDPKSMLKLEHLQRVSLWASGEGAVSSLAAFFGRRLAASREALAVLPDPSLITCQRCETILQPGYNCTVRVEKSRAKKRRRCKKPRISNQNNVVYSCLFCSHRNLKRGTPKGHMKELHPAKARPISEKKSGKAVLQSSSNPPIEVACGDESSKISVPCFLASEAVPSADNNPSTPVTKPSMELLSELKRRKRNRSAAKKPAEPEGSPANASEASVGSSKKRRRKSWTTLKEIAERRENGVGKSISGLKIPFVI